MSQVWKPKSQWHRKSQCFSTGQSNRAKTDNCVPPLKEVSGVGRGAEAGGKEKTRLPNSLWSYEAFSLTPPFPHPPPQWTLFLLSLYSCASQPPNEVKTPPSTVSKSSSESPQTSPAFSFPWSCHSHVRQPLPELACHRQADLLVCVSELHWALWCGLYIQLFTSLPPSCLCLEDASLFSQSSPGFSSPIV